MKSLFKNSLKILGGVFAVALLVFTGMQSYALLYEVSGSELVAAFGLFVFEFGMLFWWFEFQHGAEGIAQLAISGLMFVFSMLLVMAATGLHLGAFDPQLLGRETPAKLITVAVIINVVAKMVMPLVSPDMMRSIYEKVSEGMIMQKTFTQLTSKADGIAAELSDSIADVWVGELDTRINNRYKNGNPATLPAPPAVASIATQPAMNQQEPSTYQPAIIPLDTEPNPPRRDGIGFNPENHTEAIADFLSKRENRDTITRLMQERQERKAAK